MVLICGGAVAAAVSLNWPPATTDNLINRLAPAEAAASQLGASFLNQETGFRGYALSGDTAALEPYTAGEQLQTDAMAELRGLVSSTSELVADLDAIEQDAANWQTVFVEPILATTPTTGAALSTRACTSAASSPSTSCAPVSASWTSTWPRPAPTPGDPRARAGDPGRGVRVAVRDSVGRVGGVRGADPQGDHHPAAATVESSRRVALGNFGQQVDAGSGPADIRALAEDIEGCGSGSSPNSSSCETVRLDSRCRPPSWTRRRWSCGAPTPNSSISPTSHRTTCQEPLRKVASFCQLLEKRYGDVVDERGRQYIDFAVDGAKRMQVLINDLLTFSRVGRVNDGFGPVSLDHALDKAWRTSPRRRRIGCDDRATAAAARDRRRCNAAGDVVAEPDR